MQKQLLAILVASSMAVSVMAMPSPVYAPAAATSITTNDEDEELYNKLYATYQEASAYFNTIRDKAVSECPKAVAAGAINDTPLMEKLNSIKTGLSKAKEDGVLVPYEGVFNQQIKEFYHDVDSWYADCLEKEDNFSHSAENKEKYDALSNRNMMISSTSPIRYLHSLPNIRISISTA